jgi:hypothetical protein
MQIVANDESLPVAVVAAGLPRPRQVLAAISGTTFLERQPFLELTNLNSEDTRLALHRPILNAGRRIQPTALDCSSPTAAATPTVSSSSASTPGTRRVAVARSALTTPPRMRGCPPNPQPRHLPISVGTSRSPRTPLPASGGNADGTTRRIDRGDRGRARHDHQGCLTDPGFPVQHSPLAPGHRAGIRPIRDPWVRRLGRHPPRRHPGLRGEPAFIPSRRRACRRRRPGGDSTVGRRTHAPARRTAGAFPASRPRPLTARGPYDSRSNRTVSAVGDRDGELVHPPVAKHDHYLVGILDGQRGESQPSGGDRHRRQPHGRQCPTGSRPADRPPTDVPFWGLRLRRRPSFWSAIRARDSVRRPPAANRPIVTLTASVVVRLASTDRIGARTDRSRQQATSTCRRVHVSSTRSLFEIWGAFLGESRPCRPSWRGVSGLG